MGTYKYNNELYKEFCLNIGLAPLEDYNGQMQQLNHKCLVCEKIIKVQPRALSLRNQGYGCKSCIQKQNLSDTKDSFIQKLSQITSEIKIVGEYVNNKTKIECECLKCGYQWKARPNDLLSGHNSCLNCIGYVKLGKEGIKNKVEEINPNIKVISSAETARDDVKCECVICGNIWNSVPSTLYKGNGCPFCNGLTKYTTEQFVKKLSEVTEDIEFVDEYKGNKVKSNFKCLKCGKIWSAKPNNVLSSKTGCPDCSREYKLEKETKDILNKLNIEFETQKRYKDLRGVGNKPLSYDFFLPDYNKFIECQGEQHDRPIKYYGGEERFKIQQEHDKRKYEYAISIGCDIIYIPYKKMNHIEEILKQII